MTSASAATERPVTLALHRWRGNAVLSILGGTAVQIALATALSGR